VAKSTSSVPPLETVPFPKSVAANPRKTQFKICLRRQNRPFFGEEESKHYAHDQSNFVLEISLRRGILTGMSDPKPKLRWFQFSLRGMLLVVTLCALSFGLWRKAWLIDDHHTGFIWFAAGLYVFAGAIGAAIDRLSDPCRSGIRGVLISIILVSLAVWLLCAEVRALY